MFHKSYPRSFTSSAGTAFTDFPGPFLLSYSVLVFISFYGLKEPIMKILHGPKERHSRVRLWLRRKWTDLAEIWKSVSQMLGAEPHSNDSMRGSRNFVFRCPVNNADFTDFPSEKLYDIATQQRRSVRRWKLLEQNFENLTIRGR